ncbi:hypothetical protein OB969_00045 [Bacillus cereus]|uniref:Uncharacterized protein n=2 Tax=Bacillus thuringiensis TaxID=1428 RepID=A0AAW4HV22_BACTU|nr:MULTISPECIES: hypothetical protein [Bacillus cereus group]EOP93091.1 hypothetical protein IIY_00559 [Bacillus cereus VD140]MBE4937025.1 hypothetical protein [Bacillus thuringiensis]MBN9899393.1 hypothetical protein [Bacillus thuringiensis]MCC2381880.1 hypothetical protein [Bacillus cereus]MCU4976168.1 hypothetical protein [Bacillus cereus]
MSELEKSNFIQKVIMGNGIIILLLLLMGMIAIFVTGYTTNGKVLIDQISFASSLASILLAIMAMVYAFFQAKESSQQSLQVNSSLEKIDGKIIELVTIKDEISSLRSILEEQSEWINNSTEELENIVIDFKGTTEKNPKENKDELQRKIEDIEAKLNKIQENKKKTEGLINPLLLGENIQLNGNISNDQDKLRNESIKRMLYGQN